MMLQEDHPLKNFHLKKIATAAESDSFKQQVHHYFCARITCHCEGIDVSFDFDRKGYATSCECFKHLLVPENLENI